MPIGLLVKPSSTGVVNGLARLRDAFGQLRPAMDNAAAELTQRAQRRFATKTDPDGVKWRRRSSATVKKHNAMRPKGQLMRVSGQLREQTRFIGGPKTLRARVFGYGVYHEQPNGRPSAKLPRRAFLFSRRNGGRALSVEDEKYLYNAIRYQIRKAAL